MADTNDAVLTEDQKKEIKQLIQELIDQNRVYQSKYSGAEIDSAISAYRDLVDGQTIKGDKGDKGDTGATGPKGEKGDKGDKGDTGAQGLQGATGKPGADGKGAANGTFLTNESLNNYNTQNLCGWYFAAGGNTVTNKPDGVDAFGMWVLRTANGYYAQELYPANSKINTLFIRTYAGTTWTAWVEKGKTGDTGAQGPKGDKGETGAQGPQGEKGDKGEKGDTGAQGPKGDKGETGAQGPQGATGTKGQDGLDTKFTIPLTIRCQHLTFFCDYPINLKRISSSDSTYINLLNQVFKQFANYDTSGTKLADVKQIALSLFSYASCYTTKKGVFTNGYFIIQGVRSVEGALMDQIQEEPFIAWSRLTEEFGIVVRSITGGFGFEEFQDTDPFRIRLYEGQIEALKDRLNIS